MIVKSHGGGTQSVAIDCLIDAGRLPKPDLILIADTSREAAETWEYFNRHSLPMYQRWGVEWKIVGHELATVDLYSGNGDLLIPAYTETGKLPTFCSTEWKQRVIRRYLKSIGVENCVMWFGMSLDEIDRMRTSDVKWISNHYPLVFDVPLRRHECIKLVEDYGLPTPPKSSCWMCPHRRDAQWKRLKDHYPEDWAKAVDLDKQITASHNVTLHQSGKPLDQVEFDEADKELPLFAFCDSGYCMI